MGFKCVYKNKTQTTAIWGGKPLESWGKSREANSSNQISGCPENHCYLCKAGQGSRTDSIKWAGTQGTDRGETERQEIESQI